MDQKSEVADTTKANADTISEMIEIMVARRTQMLALERGENRNEQGKIDAMCILANLEGEKGNQRSVVLLIAMLLVEVVVEPAEK
ncbi:MAG TPA: hypothetical protein VER78_03055 [Thermoanaerobaculia bacterium]|nr:hypothetical protein [Thermoanaerobaculia bacterium]